MKRITILASLLGIVMTFVLIIRQLSAFEAPVLLLILFLLSPYLLIYGVGYRLEEGRGGRFFAVASWVLLIMAAAFYFDALVLHPDPQGGLVFVVVPVYQWALLLPVLTVLYVMRRKQKINSTPRRNSVSSAIMNSIQKKGRQ